MTEKHDIFISSYQFIISSFLVFYTVGLLG